MNIIVFVLNNEFLIILEDDSATGDPHFLITSRDQQNTHLCFDINGRDKDVLVLIQDADIGM